MRFTCPRVHSRPSLLVYLSWDLVAPILRCIHYGCQSSIQPNAGQALLHLRSRLAASLGPELRFWLVPGFRSFIASVFLWLSPVSRLCSDWLCCHLAKRLPESRCRLEFGTLPKRD